MAAPDNAFAREGEDLSYLHDCQGFQVTWLIWLSFLAPWEVPAGGAE
jgi:hypothetical protein